MKRLLINYYTVTIQSTNTNFYFYSFYLLFYFILFFLTKGYPLHIVFTLNIKKIHKSFQEFQDSGNQSWND